MAARGGGPSGGRLGHAWRPCGATRLLAALALGLAALAGEGAQGVDPALARAPLLAPAATLNVCPSGCPYSSIQAAINAANPGDTISVGAGTYTQALIISTTLTIAGAGAGRTLIDGQGRGGTGINLLGGHATITALTVQHWNAGGVFVDLSSSLTLSASAVSGNTAAQGGGVYNGGVLTLSNSAVSGNSATTGGGIENSGQMTLVAATVTRDSANNGGGVQNSGTLTVSNSLLSNDVALLGGGVENTGALTVTASTLSRDNAAEGGALDSAGRLVVLDSTLARDTAIAGGGLFSSGAATLTDDTLSGNMVTPPSGLPASQVTLSGQGYGAHETVTLKWDCTTPGCPSPTTLATPQTDGRGVFTTTATIPFAALGPHVIGGQGATSGAFATTTFVIG